MSETRKVWISRYALTRGVYETDVEESGGYCYSTDIYRIQYPPNAWHQTRGEALARAEEMRQAKVASLRKQLTKLERKVFS
jgi:hypothetical protein